MKPSPRPQMKSTLSVVIIHVHAQDSETDPYFSSNMIDWTRKTFFWIRQNPFLVCELTNCCDFCSWMWSCRWSTCPSAPTQTLRASCSSFAWRSLETCCWCTGRRRKWSSWRERSSRSSVSLSPPTADVHHTEGLRVMTHVVLLNDRHRLPHASQRRDGGGDDQSQRACGYLTQPAEEGDGHRRCVFLNVRWLMVCLHSRGPHSFTSCLCWCACSPCAT